MKRIVAVIYMILTASFVFADKEISLTCTDSTNLFPCKDIRYRIPAIMKLKDGTLAAYSDLRFCHGDIGDGQIDVVGRMSSDSGKTWSDEFVAIKSDSNDPGFNFAHGDAAVVADRKSKRQIMLVASGKKWYWQGGVGLGIYFSEDGKRWKGSDRTEYIKEQCEKRGVKLGRQFFTSGRIIQSSKVKVGKYFRIYSALCSDLGSVVMFSDDFGETWDVLGEKVAYAKGDETVMEELPNGDVLLSARLGGFGRGFAIFSYSDRKKGEGSWKEETSIGINEATNCNGEMLLVPISKRQFVLLHSVAMAGRKNVSIYYKVIDVKKDDFTASAFYGGDWKLLKQVSQSTSAYSTMVLDHEGNIAFLYEENLNDDGYDIIFKSYKINVQ